MIKLIPLLMIMSSAFASENCSTSSSEDKIEEQLVIDTKVPNHLKGAKIIIRLANGKESEVSADLFKVVPRKQQYLVTKVSKSSTTMCSAEQKRNRIAILGGRGPREGLNTSANPTQVNVESKVGAIGGVQYQRMLTDKISIGGQVQTNKSGLISIGLDF